MSEILVTVDFTPHQFRFFQNEKKLVLAAIECFSDYYKNGSKKSVDKMRKRARELRDAMSKAFENREEMGSAITCHVTWPEDMVDSLAQDSIVEIVSRNKKSVKVRLLWNR
jgi:hypothetical protein